MRWPKFQLVVSLSSFIDDTTARADVVLPSHTYLESWGDDIPEPGVGFPVAAISQPVVVAACTTRRRPVTSCSHWLAGLGLR